MKRFRTLRACIGLAGFAFAATGCQKSSHTRVSKYDYSNDPKQSHRTAPVETEREIDSGEYEMVAPGEMVVDPD